jgi:hypothetical protein
MLRNSYNYIVVDTGHQICRDKSDRMDVDQAYRDMVCPMKIIVKLLNVSKLITYLPLLGGPDRRDLCSADFSAHWPGPGEIYVHSHQCRGHYPGHYTSVR